MRTTFLLAMSSVAIASTFAAISFGQERPSEAGGAPRPRPGAPMAVPAPSAEGGATDAAVGDEGSSPAGHLGAHPATIDLRAAPPRPMPPVPPPPPPPVVLERRNTPVFVSGIVVASLGAPFVALGAGAIVVGGAGTVASLAGAGDGAIVGPQLMLGGAIAVGIGAVPVLVGLPLVAYGGAKVPTVDPSHVGSAEPRRAVAARRPSPVPTVRVAPGGATASWAW